MNRCLLALFLVGSLGVVSGCGGDDANALKVGGECSNLQDCGVDPEEQPPPLECLAGFKGGYCGKTGCTASSECPEGSACADFEGTFYCFLTCTDKSECNQNRGVDNESNCSSNYKTVENTEQKLCIPPAG